MKQEKFALAAPQAITKKMDHANLVKPCNKFIDGTCKYENETCWFRHKDNEKIEENGNEEVVQGILKMMILVVIVTVMNH